MALGYKTGGRKRGTCNKVSGTVKQWIQRLIDTHRKSFEEDLSEVDPSERLKILTSLIPYVTPKLQSLSPEQVLQAEYAKLRELLEDSPEEAVNEIVERIKKLKDYGRTKD